jgi:hypothetical protein
MRKYIYSAASFLITFLSIFIFQIHEVSAAGVNRAPVCSGSTSATIQPGNTFTATMTVFDQDANEELRVDAIEFPDGAGLSYAPGSYLIPPFPITFNFTPTQAQAGLRIVSIVRFTDLKGASGQCTLDLAVAANAIQIPTCNAGGNYSVQSCSGNQVNIALNGSGSSSIYQPQIYQWSTNCSGGTITGGNIAQPILTLPRQSVTQNCSVFLKFVASKVSASCSASISNQACTLDCLNIPGGTSVIDQCGVCNGRNSCLDCRGVPFGTSAIDKCGICGGTNACLDCAGTPFGSIKVDQCGVCGGNGICGSSNSCKDINQTSLLAALDGLALSEKRLIQDTVKTLKGKISSRSAKNYLMQADNLYHTAWENVWAITKITTSCDNSTGCITTSSASKLTQYTSSMESLKKLSQNLLNILRKQRNLTSRYRSHVAKRSLLNSQRPALTSEVAVTTTSCK